MEEGFSFYSASTGKVYKVLDCNSVNALQAQVTRLTGMTPSDQILLFGPPYKPLSPAIQLSSYNMVDMDIFLYNKQFLSRGAVEPAEIIIGPLNFEGST